MAGEVESGGRADYEATAVYVLQTEFKSHNVDKSPDWFTYEYDR